MPARDSSLHTPFLRIHDACTDSGLWWWIVRGHMSDANALLHTWRGVLLDSAAQSHSQEPTVGVRVL